MTKRNIENLAITALMPSPENPRKHPEKQLHSLVKSMEMFGFTLPILIDENNVILAGRAKWEAAKLSGMTQVPCLRISHFTEEQKRAYIIADNRLAEMAKWDEDLLRKELGALQTEFGIDFGALGFSERDLADLMIDGCIDRSEREDDLPASERVPVSMAGDLWVLGDHRLICGDATDYSVVGRLLDGDRPHLMVTDPPYGVHYDPKWRARAGLGESARVGAVRNDDRSDWREAWMLFPGSVAYVWHGALQVLSVAESLLACGFDLRAQIVWAKERFALSRGEYHWQHESCWYAAKGLDADGECPDARTYGEGCDLCFYAVREKRRSRWCGGRKQSTLWEIGYSGQDQETWHGTQKPVECMRRPIMNNSQPGDSVYEPFSGSGTTIIAAQSVKRRCLAVEIDPLYVDLAVRRWENYTGRRAVLEGGGGSFEEIRQERSERGGSGDE